MGEWCRDVAGVDLIEMVHVDLVPLVVSRPPFSACDSSRPGTDPKSGAGGLWKGKGI